MILYISKGFGNPKKWRQLAMKNGNEVVEAKLTAMNIKNNLLPILLEIAAPAVLPITLLKFNLCLC